MGNCCAQKLDGVNEHKKTEIDLEKIDVTNVVPFSFKGEIYKARVIDVHDGDTVKCVIIYNGKPVIITLRFAGINAPELRPTYKTPDRENVIKAAVESTNFLKQMIENKIITIQCGAFDCFGRVIAIVIAESNTGVINVNELMLKQKKAIPFRIKDAHKAFAGTQFTLDWLDKYDTGVADAEEKNND